jgi:transcriptional regulator with XRE-family HTH domain
VSGSETSKQFGAAVRKRRLAVGLSQESLAERAGIHPVYVSMVERGTRNPTVDVAFRIAHALRISLARLFSHTERLRKPKISRGRKRP